MISSRGNRANVTAGAEFRLADARRARAPRVPAVDRARVRRGGGLHRHREHDGRLGGGDVDQRPAAVVAVLGGDLVGGQPLPPAVLEQHVEPGVGAGPPACRIRNRSGNRLRGRCRCGRTPGKGRHRPRPCRRSESARCSAADEARCRPQPDNRPPAGCASSKATHRTLAVGAADNDHRHRLPASERALHTAHALQAQRDRLGVQALDARQPVVQRIRGRQQT